MDLTIDLRESNEESLMFRSDTVWLPAQGETTRMA
jgi:hypothetical protein